MGQVLLIKNYSFNWAPMETFISKRTLHHLGNDVSSPAASGMHTMFKSQPFEAYQNHGITATFYFQPNTAGQAVCRVVAVFNNSNSYDGDCIFTGASEFPFACIQL